MNLRRYFWLWLVDVLRLRVETPRFYVLAGVAIDVNALQSRSATSIIHVPKPEHYITAVSACFDSGECRYLGTLQ